MKNPEWPKHEAIYDECMKRAKIASGQCAHWHRVNWIHLSDAVEQGTISPLEAYDAFKLDYLPEHLTVRKSRYSHLVH